MPGDSPEDIVRSWLEDLKRELGSSGPITTYKETKDLLERPEQGFADSADQKITFVTNSIGGPQAMRDTILFHKRVSRLTTNASPGVDRETADLFREVLSQPRETPLIITHNIDKGDIVDTVGDEHVGANCPNASLTFRSLALASPHAPAQEGQRRWSVANRLETFLFSGIPQLLSNVMGIFEAHMRTSVIENYTEEVVSTDDPATHDIAIAYAQHLPPHFDPSWERVRRFICPVPSPGFAAFARQVLGTA